MGEFIELLAVIGIVVFVIIGGILAVCEVVHVSTSPGSGSQIGYISEVSNNGLFWKPTQISLINSEPTYGSQTDWDYGAQSPEITTAAMKYMNTHQKVIVHYEGYFWVWGWDHPTNEVITGIELAGGDR